MDPCIVEHTERDWSCLMQPYLLRRNDIIDIKYLKKRAISFHLFFQCACIGYALQFHSVSLGSLVHYDAAVAATAATAACNLEVENRENRRVKMKRGSSQGKWGNAFPRCISIYSVSAHACTYVHTYMHSHTDVACTKTAGFGRKLTPFPTFHSAYCFSLLLIAALLYNESPCRFCPRIRSDLKRLRAVVEPRACSNCKES